MRYFAIFLISIILLITSCTTIPTDLPPDTAVTSPTEDSMPPTSPNEFPSSPQPDDSNLIRGNVYINSTELLIRESFPPQISLGISGDLPTPCHQLRVEISDPDPENRISADVYSLVDPGRACIQVLKPFQKYIDLGTFPTGHYTVWINGDKVGEFDT